MNAKQQIQDELYYAAIQAVRHVATSKAVVNENARRFGISQFDSGKLMSDAYLKVTERLQATRVEEQDRKLRKMKALHARMQKLHDQLNKA